MDADQLTADLDTQPDHTHDSSTGWSQVNVEFHDWTCAAKTTAAHLQPILDTHTRAWWYIRKYPHWRIRYLRPADEVDHHVHAALCDLVAVERLRAWHHAIYEPEARAFGGIAGMAIAHDLFRRDSPTALALLTTSASTATRTPSSATHGRAEVSVLAISRMLRAARLDWFEQGDVWARVADLRQEPGEPHPAPPTDAVAAMRRLLTIDTSPVSPLLRDGPLVGHAAWLAAFDDTGTRLADLAKSGHLNRGLRAVLAHHVIFHWNRLALTRRRQLALASLARDDLLPTDLDTP
ncbi:MAG: thiopeptide-type bacteriocin biosynthesis protein [Pseudonocardia sp.]